MSATNLRQIRRGWFYGVRATGKGRSTERVMGGLVGVQGGDRCGGGGFAMTLRKAYSVI